MKVHQHHRQRRKNTRSDKETDSIDNEQDMAASSDAGEPASGQGAEQDKAEGSDMDSKVLVAYFSCTNTTKELAEYAAEILGADLYEIVPEDPYTEEDLAYYTDGRADQEQNDPSVRPAISGEVENMSQYDTIVISNLACVPQFDTIHPSMNLGANFNDRNYNIEDYVKFPLTY